MEETPSLFELVTTQNATVPILGFVINLLLAALLAYILSRVYARFGHSLSNRESFGANFVLITMTTMLIITIVKSSLALSLGLVGALSIIRFRAAIKEPEELTYLFLSISVGLGFGANQGVITCVAFVLILAVIVLKHSVHPKETPSNLHLTITGLGGGQVGLPQILEVLNRHTAHAQLKRLDEHGSSLEAAFQIRIDRLEQLEACRERLRELGDDVHVSFIDHQGLHG